MKVGNLDHTRQPAVGGVLRQLGMSLLQVPHWSLLLLSGLASLRFFWALGV